MTRDWRQVGLGLWLLALLSAATPPRAVAGPNAGGVILLHCNEAIDYSSGASSYCGLSGLGACYQADTRVDRTSPVVFHVFAAFPAAASPRLLGIYFGIDYDNSLCRIQSYGSCGVYAYKDDTWPAPGTGSFVAWDAAQTSHLTEIYWFLGYVYSTGPTTVGLTYNPTAGGFFVDDSPLEILDDIADYGRLGFFTDGYLPCPDPPPVPVMEGTWGRIKARYR